MNISDRPDPQARPIASPVPPVRPDAASTQDERSATGAPTAADPTDRVEISAAGRAQSAGAVPDADLDTARVALRSEADLDAARVESLRADVRAGKYDGADVIARVADAAVRNLSP